VLETALEAELTEHLGHEHGQTPIAANMRNGTRPKTVLTEIGPVEIEVPRDRDGSFECIVHLIRNSFRYAGRQHRDGIVKALKPVYTAPSEQAAKDRFAEFTAEWGQRYPAIIRLWESSWAEFVPFLEYDVEIRRVICTTNAIESINARYRRAVRARGHFPNETAALKMPLSGHQVS